jgi:hypothetical protein
MSQRHRSAAALGCSVVAALEATAAYGQESNPRNVSIAPASPPRSPSPDARRLSDGYGAGRHAGSLSSDLLRVRFRWSLPSRFMT